MKDPFFAALIAALFWAAICLLPAGPAVPGKEQAVQALAVADGQDQSAETEQGAIQTQPPAEAEAADFDRSFRLPVLCGQELRSMDLRSYLTGVLLAEMPASFEPEARKAQAVACRTYALRLYAHRKHDAAAVCTDSGCCQGWVDPESVPLAARQAAQEAVDATDALVVVCDGALIDATFFSCSGGRTEAAAAVWGTDLPYLQAVDSPGEEEAAHFTDEKVLSLTEFCSILRKADPGVDFPAALGGWVGEVTSTEGGGVATMELGGRVFTGTELRKLFGLRSTDFTLRLGATQAVFTTHGFGHRVGLSQYGANAMAKEGADFREILTHYYQGVEVEPYGEMKK